MSKENASNKGSPQKHKGMKTSLYNNEQFYRQEDSNIYTNPHRVYVQTISEQPNVMPYIDSQYSNQPHIINQAQSQYVPVIERQNNFLREVRPQVVQSFTRVSPLQTSHVATNLSRTKYQTTDQNRYQHSGSTFVPPPPQSFLINNTKVPEHRSPSMGKTVITVSPPPIATTNFQSVKKTFVPHHIINEIPVYGGGSVYAQSASQQRESSGNDQSQQVLMGYYEKLYAKFEAQRQQNQSIRQQLSDAVNQINYLQVQLQNKQVVHQTIVSAPQKRKVIDRQLLHQLLSHKWNRVVDQVIERRKQACLRQVSKMVETSKVTLKIPGEFVEQQVSQVYYRG